jgi:sugar phosphate isomerase/epimerase
MSAPISVQLYSLREASSRDFDAVLAGLAEVGFAGVEPFNLYGMRPRAFRDRVEALGMRVSSSHFPWANRAPMAQVIDVVGELGLSRAAGGFGPDDFKDADALARTADTVNAMVAQLGAAGIELFLHNHWWEYRLIDGRPAYYLLAERCPDVAFEIDTYWAADFGARDPAQEVARLRARAPLLHIKDGPLTENAPHTAVGKGKLDVRNIIAAADPTVLEWLIVELDACATDMFTAIEESYEFLTANGLGHGTRP